MPSPTPLSGSRPSSSSSSSRPGLFEDEGRGRGRAEATLADSAGVSLAASRMNAGQRTFRTSVTGEPRGPLCGMGICFECRSELNGDPHQRTCQVVVPIEPAPRDAPTADFPLRPRPSSSPSRTGPFFEDEGRGRGRTDKWGERLDSDPESVEAEVLVVGAGPAGIAAACVAAECGKRVVMIDDNPGRGGQLWRGEERAPKTGLARRWFDRLAAAKVTTLTGWNVMGSSGPGGLVAERQGRSMRLTAPAIVLATGARELFLPFPGWTHPHVVGAGGLQALAKAGLELKGRTVIVAGSGPLLLAVAHNLRQRGARVPFIAEQANRSPILRFGLSLAAHPSKLAQALSLGAGLLGVPHRTACWPVRAEADGSRLKVTFRRGRETFVATCDDLACGWGLVPNLELPRLLGCTVAQGVVQIDEWQQTSQAGVFTAGETTGIAGLEGALEAGQIAGYAAAGQRDSARRHFAGREKARRFAKGLGRAFALRDELRKLPEDSTMVCRCEDVTFGRLRLHESSQAAKLQTRCGMGACQGRVCGAAMEFLLGWEPASVRPPIFPVSVSTLAHLAGGDGSKRPHPGN